MFDCTGDATDHGFSAYRINAMLDTARAHGKNWNGVSCLRVREEEEITHEGKWRSMYIFARNFHILC